MLGSLPLALALAAAAATPTSLRVLVLDPSGAAVPTAAVSLVIGDEVREAETDRGGSVVFEGLPLGRAEARASLPGFEPGSKLVTLRAGRNDATITLPLARRTEDVQVRPVERASASLGFGSVLTPSEIAALPDDPEELEQALRRIAGPDAVLRVNGFSGGRLPPKSQIRQIRFQMNPYSAEFHEAGHGRIDVLTKPGLGSWRTGLKSSLRNAALNARPPLAPAQPADDYARYGFSLDGPLLAGRTSFAFNLDGRSNDGARTIRASAPAGPVSELAPQASDKLELQARLEHAWGASHTLRAEYQRLGHDQRGLAQSGFDLRERGYAQHDLEQLVRFSDTGALGRRAATETLLELRFARTDYAPQSAAPAVQVLGAFNAGGAQVDGRRSSSGLSLTQNVDWGTKKHTLRSGFRLEAERQANAERRNAAGTFVFPSLEAYRGARPALFTRQTGDPRVSFDQLQLGLYLQDEIKLNRRATLSLGLRNEMQSGVAGALHPGPRLGFAYALGGRTTLRLGAGVFREWFGAATRAETLRLDGGHAFDSVLTSPSYPELPVAELGSAAMRNRYLPVAELGLPRVERASAGLERTFGEAVRLRLDLSLERGRAALRSINRNAPAPGSGRPDPSQGNLLELVAEGRSRRRLANASGGYMKPGAPWSLFLGYMLTDARNDGDALSVPTTPTGLPGEWGPAPMDVRHRGFGFGRARLAKRFALSALFRLESGAPYNVTTGFDENGDSVVNDRPAGVSRNAARGAARLSLDLRLSWSRGFGPERQPRGPTAHIMRMGDGEMPPDIPAGDANRRFQASLYAQAFNATNHTNPIAYSGVRTSPFFGQPSQAEPGRRIELGLSLGF
jgi:hypothetical protein